MRLGPYEIVSEIGRGGSGVVFEARGPGGERLALKLLLAARAGPDGRARFVRERRILEGLGESEGFVPLLDAGEAPEGPFLVMPLLPGGTLRDRLRRGPLGIEPALALGRALARAVGCAHALGIVHRDLKPENVLFDGAGRPLVSDLGLAKDLRAEGGSLSKTGAFLGTAAYVSPEQIENAKAAGPATDVFSLGVVLFECLAGAHPFSGATTLEFLARISRGAHEPLRRLRPDVPAWLAAAVERALAVEPSRRFADGAALARALEGPGGGRGRAVALVAAGLAAAGLVTLSVLVGPRKAPAPVTAPTTPTPALDGRAAAKLLAGRAVALTSENLCREAVAAATSALALDPGSALAYASRGDAFFQLGQDERALADLDRAVALDPRNAWALAMRGEVLLEKELFDRARADLDRALALDPKCVTALAGRGELFHRQRDYPRALADLDRALALEPTRHTVHARRGGVYSELGELDKALAALDRAIALNASIASYFANRATVHARKGDHARALPDFERALALRPTPSAFADRGTLYLREGRFDQAIADFGEAIALDPRLARAYSNRGAARIQKGDLAGARVDLERATALDPASAYAWTHLATTKAESGDRAGARADYEKALTLTVDEGLASEIRQALALLGP